MTNLMAIKSKCDSEYLVSIQIKTHLARYTWKHTISNQDAYILIHCLAIHILWSSCMGLRLYHGKCLGNAWPMDLWWSFLIALGMCSLQHQIERSNYMVHLLSDHHGTSMLKTIGTHPILVKISMRSKIQLTKTLLLKQLTKSFAGSTMNRLWWIARRMCLLEDIRKGVELRWLHFSSLIEHLVGILGCQGYKIWRVQPSSIQQKRSLNFLHKLLCSSIMVLKMITYQLHMP